MLVQIIIETPEFYPRNISSGGFKTLLPLNECPRVLPDLFSHSRMILQKFCQLGMIDNVIFIVDETWVLFQFFGDRRVSIEKAVEVPQLASRDIAVARLQLGCRSRAGLGKYRDSDQ